LSEKVNIEKLKTFVRSLPCWYCNDPRGSDPHHLTVDDKQRRAVDIENLLPLCRRCHDWFKFDPKGVREERRLMPLMKEEAVRIYKVFREGVLNHAYIQKSSIE